MIVQKSIKETSVMLSFSILPDPRKYRNQEYPLMTLLADFSVLLTL